MGARPPRAGHPYRHRSADQVDHQDGDRAEAWALPSIRGGGGHIRGWAVRDSGLCAFSLGDIDGCGAALHPEGCRDPGPAREAPDPGADQHGLAIRLAGLQDHGAQERGAGPGDRDRRLYQCTTTAELSERPGRLRLAGPCRAQGSTPGRLVRRHCVRADDKQVSRWRPGAVGRYRLGERDRCGAHGDLHRPDAG